MGELENKMLVHHVSLGVGKIVALDANAVHVFFPESDKRFAAKLRLPAAKALLRTDGVGRDAWLEGLSAFSLDPKTGRYGLAATWLTQDQAMANFMSAYPQGFADPSYLGTGNGERAALWRLGNEAWVEALGNGEGERLLAAADVGELVKRALQVERHVSPLQPSTERKDTLKEALADPDAALVFFGALFDVLGVPVPGRARFEKLFAAASRLPVVPAAMWPVATLFPFIAQPDRHVFLRPKPAREAAERLGCDLRFDETPNWPTYAALRALSTRLLEVLQPNGARDFIDVESFLHLTATRRPHAAKAVKAISEGDGEQQAPPRPTRGAARGTRRIAHSRSMA